MASIRPSKYAARQRPASGPPSPAARRPLPCHTAAPTVCACGFHSRPNRRRAAVLARRSAPASRRWASSGVLRKRWADMARTSIAERNKDRIAGDRRATARPGQAFATEYRVRAGLLLAVFGHQCRPDNTVRKPLERHPGPALAWPHESRSRRLLQRHPRARRPLRRTLLHRGQDHAHLLPSGLSGAHALSRNVVFYATAAAWGAGFHPCLPPGNRARRRPAPGLPASVARALQLIELGALDDGDLDALAARTGVGARQLRRQFREHLGASPSPSPRPAACCWPSN